MTSARSITLGLGPTEEDIAIQLGSLVRRRGLKGVNGILYPAFIGAYIDQPGLNTTVPPSGSLDLILGGTNSLPLSGDNLVSSAVVYDPAARSLTMPFLGFHRLKIKVAYTYGLDDGAVLSFNLDGVPFEVSRTAQLVEPELVYNQILEFQTVSDITITNGGTDDITVVSKHQPDQMVIPSIQVEYLGQF